MALIIFIFFVLALMIGVIMGVKVIKKSKEEKEKEKKKKKEERIRAVLLDKPTLLEELIIKRWWEEGIEKGFSKIVIKGKDKGKIKIEIQGEKRDVYPKEVIFVLEEIPGFPPFERKDLTELKGLEKKILVGWIIRATKDNK